MLGQHLEQLAEQPPLEFERRVRHQLWHGLAYRLSHLDPELARPEVAASSWGRDLAGYREHLLERAECEGAPVPAVFQCHQSTGRELIAAQAFVGAFGRLCRHWPALLLAARELEENGRGLFRTTS
jgi:hypothetical protein